VHCLLIALIAGEFRRIGPKGLEEPSNSFPVIGFAIPTLSQGAMGNGHLVSLSLQRFSPLDRSGGVAMSPRNVGDSRSLQILGEASRRTHSAIIEN
jgi:hypothetical protein